MSFPGFSAEASVYRTKSVYIGHASLPSSTASVEPQGCECPGMPDWLCWICMPAIGAAWASCLPANLASCEDYKNCVFGFLAATGTPFCVSCAASTAKDWCGPCTTCTNCQTIEGLCFCDDAFCGFGPSKCCTTNSGAPSGGGDSGSVHNTGGPCCGGGRKCCGQCAYDPVVRKPVCSGDCVKVGEPCS